VKDNTTVTTQLYLERAVSILEDHSPDDPLFLYMAIQNNHAPLDDFPDEYFTAEGKPH
jgi:hypothetical protein